MDEILRSDRVTHEVHGAGTVIQILDSYDPFRGKEPYVVEFDNGIREHCARKELRKGDDGGESK